MNCERIQDLILTDYFDGVLESNVRKELEAHLANCPQCLDFAKAARKTAFESFEGASKAAPPANVWERVEERLQEENAPSQVESPSWLENLKSVFSLPRPALVLAAVLVLFVAAGTMDQIRSRKALNRSSVEYIAALIESATDDTVNDNDDFGTDVEQVFL